MRAISKQHQQWLSLAGRVGVSAALLGLVLWQIDLPGTARLLGEVTWRWAVMSWLVLLGLVMLMGFRWYFILPRTGCGVRYGQVMRLTWVSGVLGVFVPGVIGIEAVKIAGMARCTSDLAQAFSSVMLDRLLGLLALIILVLIGVSAGPLGDRTAIAMWAWGVFLVSLLGAAAMMNHRLRAVCERMCPAVVRTRIAPRLHKLYHRLDEYRAQPVRLIIAIGLALVYQLGRVAHFIFAAWALGVHPPIAFMVAIVPVVIFVLMLPISFGGLGVREASFVYFMSQIGVPAESAFTISMLAYVLHVSVMLPGVFMLRGWRQPATRRPAATTAPGVPVAAREEASPS